MTPEQRARFAELHGKRLRRRVLGLCPDEENEFRGLRRLFLEREEDKTWAHVLREVLTRDDRAGDGSKCK